MSVDQEYLSARLSAITGQTVLSITIEKLKGDASERNFYRLRLDERQSLVLMEFNPPKPDRQLDVELVGGYFYRHQLGVPRLYYHDKQKGLLFFEDCGELTLEQLVHNESAANYYPCYEQAIDLLLKIQQTGRDNIDTKCPAFGLAFDTEKLSFELDFFLQHMLEGQRKLELSPQDKQELRAHFLDLCRILAAEPRCLTHRDYHSRNVMVKDGRIKLVDFQDARMGLCQYDLASLLRDSYVQLDDGLVDSLLEYYIRGKERLEGVFVDRERFRQVFDYTSIQRNLKAVGSFAYLAGCRGLSFYLKFIPPTLEYVSQNLSKYPELKKIKLLLSKYLPEVSAS